MADKSSTRTPGEITEISTDTGSSKMLIWGFALIIAVGTLLLKLPGVTESGKPLTWIEALFTATSATTVTGLALFNTETQFSLWGEIVILILIQVGGIGFITLSVVLFRLIGRRIPLGERRLVGQILGLRGSNSVVQLALTVAFITVAIELLGAIFLFVGWLPVMAPGKAAYYALFHSISAYCNAGFDLFHGTTDPLLLTTRRSPWLVFILSALILIGTMGITLIFDLVSFPRTRQFSLHTKLILPLIALLTVGGTFLLLLDGDFYTDVLTAMPPDERLLMAFFTTVSSRTAGITFVPVQDLALGSQLIILVWMFIGGAPASMGGGVGLSTIAVMLITLQSNVRGYPDVRVVGRTIPTETVYKANAIVTVSMLLVLVMTFGILFFDHTGSSLFEVVFEVVSAFSNTGYSLGITGNLNQMSRLILIFTMFWGRLGPLTLVVALAQRDRRTQVKYPEERIIIG